MLQSYKGLGTIAEATQQLNFSRWEKEEEATEEELIGVKNH